MEEKTDLRIIKTKMSLFNTLETLMKDMSFEEIKVSDICNNALVNRSTFYAHYSDKYELLSAYINTLKDNLLKELAKNTSSMNTKEYYIEMLRLLLTHIEAKKQDYSAIMINNKNSIVMDILYDVINRDIIKEIDKTLDNSEVPSEIVAKFYSGAIFNVCLIYISSKKYTKEEILSYFDKLLPNE